MIILASTSDILRVVTSSTANLDVHATWMEWQSAAAYPTPGRTNTAISSATTTTIVAAPGASTFRTLKTVVLANRHASTSQTVTVQHFDGTTSAQLFSVTLPAGWSLQYNEGRGWAVYDSNGRELANSLNTAAPTVNTLNVVVLATDVTNNNAVANTIQDVTGFSFAVVAGQTFWFRAVIFFTSAATTTGSRWSVSGPGAPTFLSYRSMYSLTTTSDTLNTGLTAYDLPAAANATSATAAGNTAMVEGTITPSSDGTVIIRFASEVSNSAIVAKAGSILQWIRTL